MCSDEIENCIECSNESGLQCTQCKSPLVPDSAGQQCNQCSELLDHCITCLNFDTCTQCVDNTYELDGNNACQGTILFWTKS